MKAMTHPDEHTLELIAAGSKGLGELEFSVRRHLAECEHCRQMFIEIQEFYSDVEITFQKQSATSEDLSSTVPVRSVSSPRYGSIKPRLQVEEKVSPYKLASRLIIRHPVISSAGTIGFLALLGLLVASSLRTSVRDTNPSYVRLNPQGSFIEVYNREDQLLWSKPSLDVNEAITFQNTHRQFAEILNMTGDNRNEVALALKLGGDNDEWSIGTIRLLDGHGQVLTKIHLGSQVSFGGKQYSDDYANQGIASVPATVAGQRLLVAAATNYRSPCVFSVIDSSQRVVGEYWHYGHLTSPLETPDVAGKGRSGVLLIGMNDAADSAGIRFPVLVAIDPQKIHGATESSASRGFGFANSAAEIAYLRFPLGDVVQVLNERMAASLINTLSKDRINVLVSSKSVSLEFVFSSDLTPVEVKATEGYIQMHERLKKEGKIVSVLDRAYLAHIMEGIQFWDGKSWKNERNLVNQ
jgi:hypothetical protein